MRALSQPLSIHAGGPAVASPRQSPDTNVAAIARSTYARQIFATLMEIGPNTLGPARDPPGFVRGLAQICWGPSVVAANPMSQPNNDDR